MTADVFPTEMFAGFGDFAFYRVTLKAAHLVAGFGRIVDLKPRDILTETGDAAELLAAGRAVELLAALRYRMGSGQRP